MEWSVSGTLDKLEGGEWFRKVLAFVMRFLGVAAAIFGLYLAGRGLWTFFSNLKYVFNSADSGVPFNTALRMELATLWGAAVVLAFLWVACGILFYRARKVMAAPAERVIPLVAQLVRLSGELVALTMVSGALTSVLGLINLDRIQSIVFSMFGLELSDSFWGVAGYWLLGLLIALLAALLVLALFHLVAESIMLQVQIAENTAPHKDAKKGKTASAD